MVGLVLPARGVAADALGQVTYWAVALLFFLYGAKLDPASVKAGMLNWRLQGLTFAATYLMIPVLGMAFALIFGDLLGPQVTLGLVFLAVLPRRSKARSPSCRWRGATSRGDLRGVAVEPGRRGADPGAGRGAVEDRRGRRQPGRRAAHRHADPLPFVLGQILRPWVGRSCATARR